MRVRSGIVWMLLACGLGASAIVWLLAERQPDASRSDSARAAPVTPPDSGVPSLITADPTTDSHAIQGRLVGPPGLSWVETDVQIGVLEDRGAGWWSPQVLARPHVSASGRFTARIAKPGPLWIHARLDHAERSYRTCYAGPRTGLPSHLVMRPPHPLETTRKLRVSVAQPNGDALRAGWVVAMQEGAIGGLPGRGEWFRNGGPAVLAIQESAHTMWIGITVSASTPGTGLPCVVGPLAAAGGHLHLTLPAATHLEGRVVDQDERAVANEFVTARPAVTDWPAELARLRMPKVLTDAKGHFDLRPLPPGAYEVVLPMLEGTTPRRAHTDEAPVTVRVSLQTRLEITVHDEAGKPLPGARIRAYLMENMRAGGPPPGWHQGARMGISDAQGIARIQGLDREKPHRLTVWPPGNRRDLRGISRDDWRPASETLRLVSKQLLRVEVRDEEGQPLTHATAWFRVVEPKHAEEGFNRMSFGHDGRWQMDYPGEMTLEVRATHGDRPSASDEAGLQVTGPGDYVLTLQRGPTLRLRLVGLRGSTSRLPVRIEEVGDRRTAGGQPHRWFTVLDAEGRCEVFGLSRERRYRVLIGDPKLGGWGTASGLRPGGEEIAVEATPGGALRGTVLEARGVPETDAFVSLMCVGRPFGARVDERGRFEIPSIPSGRWRAVAVVYAGGHVVRRGSVEVEPDQDVTITLRDVGK